MRKSRLQEYNEDVTGRVVRRYRSGYKNPQDLEYLEVELSGEMDFLVQFVRSIPKKVVS